MTPAALPPAATEPGSPRPSAHAASPDTGMARLRPRLFLTISLLVAGPSVTLAQRLPPDAGDAQGLGFSLATWDPWARRVLPRLLPEPVRAGAPPFTLPVWSPDPRRPRTRALADLQGHVVVIDFWARSCPPCVPLHEHLVRQAPVWETQGVRVISILTEEDPAGLSEFFSAHGGPPPFPVLLDSDGAVLHAFDSYGLPSMVLLDHFGRVAWRLSGGSSQVDALPILLPTLLAARARSPEAR